MIMCLKIWQPLGQQNFRMKEKRTVVCSPFHRCHVHLADSPLQWVCVDECGWVGARALSLSRARARARACALSLSMWCKHTLGLGFTNLKCFTILNAEALTFLTELRVTWFRDDT